jgi:hypothetical protein
MLRRVFFAIGLGSLAIGPALADIINVTVNGSVSGSGGVAAQCINPAPECVQINPDFYAEFFPFSFSVTNTQLGFFSASGSATATGSNIGEGYGGSVEAETDQNTAATANTLDIALSGFCSYQARAADCTANDSIAVSFNLTQESEIQLTASVPGFSPGNGELLDSKGNVILVIPPFGPFSVSTVLQPGTYQLDESVMGSAFGSFGSVSHDFGTAVNASFTPVVPEPRWVIIATLLATMFGGYVVSCRRRVA